MRDAMDFAYQAAKQASGMLREMVKTGDLAASLNVEPAEFSRIAGIEAQTVLDRVKGLTPEQAAAYTYSHALTSVMVAYRTARSELHARTVVSLHHMTVTVELVRRAGME